MPAKNLHILLVDDETEISSLVASVLQRAGHSVDLAEDGQPALDLLGENPGRYDLVITDSNMPCLSGIELIQHLRKTGFPGKIILLSGYVADESQDIYRELNIDRILQKPFAFSELMKSVNETCAV
jgi:DNA-binding response OmpR family regulator